MCLHCCSCVQCVCCVCVVCGVAVCLVFQVVNAMVFGDVVRVAVPSAGVDVVPVCVVVLWLSCSIMFK